MSTHKGRPKSCVDRSDKEIRVYDLLDSLGIEYFRVDHSPTEKMEACREIDKELGIVICKNLFLCNRQKTRFYLLMMPANKPYMTRIFSKLVHSSRLSFGTPEDMERLLDVTPGSVSIMGLMNDHSCEVTLYIDKEVLDADHIGCHPCINTSSLRMKTSDITDIFLPAIKHTFTEVELPWE